MKLTIKIALISDNRDVNRDMQAAVGRYAQQSVSEEFDLEVFTSLPSIEESLITYGPHLIFICIDLEKDKEKLNYLEQLARIALHIPVVVLAPNLDSTLMLACVKKGVRDFLKFPFQENEVAEIIRRLVHDSPVHAPTRQPGRVYTFFSYKGGIGTTFLACNTAVALARMTESRVLIWDLVMQNGDVPFFFDYHSEATVVDLIENATKIDEPYLRGILPVHSSGVSILPCPKRPEQAEGIRNDQIQALLQTIRNYFDYIIIDGGHTLTDYVISAMDASKHILLTSNLHLPVLKNTLRSLEVFERLGYSEEKFKILLNRYNSKFEKFDMAKAQDILRYPISFTFSNDYFTVSRSLNTGIPVADLDKNSILAKEFNDLAELLLTSFKPKGKKEGGQSLAERLKGLLAPKAKKEVEPPPARPKAQEGKQPDAD